MTILLTTDDFDIKTVGTLITVGFMSKPFKRLFDMLLPVVDLLPRPIVIQSGELQNHEIFHIADFVVNYVSIGEMKKWTKEANLIISHAGVGSVKLANSFKKRPIVLDRRVLHGEHIDDHQDELAEKLASVGLVTRIPSNSSCDHLKEIIICVKKEGLPEVGQIKFEYPDINAVGTVLAVSSVGGHRAEIIPFVEKIKSCPVIYMTDEICEEVKIGKYVQFPSCNKRSYIFIRVMQALIYLIQHPEIRTVITTGAGVGAIFIIAGKILGLRTIAIESLTRIQNPGLWFKVAGRISSQSYGFSWSLWLSDFRDIKKIDVSIS